MSNYCFHLEQKCVLSLQTNEILENFKLSKILQKLNYHNYSNKKIDTKPKKITKTQKIYSK